MSTGNTTKPKKGSRVTETFLQPNRFSAALDMLKRADVMVRIGMCVLAGILFWLITAGWERPFPYREGQIPERAITARVAFSTVNDAETEKAREVARDQVVKIYGHDRAQIEQLRKQLTNEVRQLVAAESYEALLKEKSTAGLWNDFLPTVAKNETKEPSVAESPKPADAKALFVEFKSKFENDEDLKKYEEDVKTAMAKIDENGLLKALQHDFDKEGGNQEQIRVVSGTEAPRFVETDELYIDNALAALKPRLEKELSEPLARHTYIWFAVKDRLKQTLTIDRSASEIAANEAAKAVNDILNPYDVGRSLAPGGEPLTSKTIDLLRTEHEELAAQTSLATKLAMSVSHFGMYAAIFSLCGFYSIFRRREVLTDKHSLIRVLCLSVATLLLCRFAADNFSETVLIPLLLFSMTIVIAMTRKSRFCFPPSSL